MALTCSVAGCSSRHHSRGFCDKHYQEWRRDIRRTGQTFEPVVHPPAIERVMARVVHMPGPLDTECWVCTLTTNGAGYCKISVGSHLVYAHRLSYEHHVGPIPEGLQLDHLCRVTRCVNPVHLEPVTHRENMLRGMAPGAVTYRSGLCSKGHSRQDNYVWNGRRYCRECRRLWDKSTRRTS